MEAKNLNKENYIVKSVHLTGVLNRNYITHEDILRGGELVFQIGNEVN
ncbi:hypothetical protein [Flavivirga amylovorans]